MFIARIEKVRAREIIDSRGNPTIEADVYLDDGTVGTGAANLRPSSSATGTRRASAARA